MAGKRRRDKKGDGREEREGGRKGEGKGIKEGIGELYSPSECVADADLSFDAEGKCCR